MLAKRLLQPLLRQKSSRQNLVLLLLMLSLNDDGPLLLDDDAVDFVQTALLVVVYEVAARPVRTQAGRVVSPTQIGLVLGMADHRTQLGPAVGELALVAVLARAVLFEGSAKFGLVTAKRRRAEADQAISGGALLIEKDGGGGKRRRGRRYRFAGASIERSSLTDW